MNGGWFWWGAKDPDTFIKLWRQMFEYFSQTKGLDNLLWVYSPNHGNKTAAYYAGGRYVDLVGLDAYTDFVDTAHIRGTPRWPRLKSRLVSPNMALTARKTHRAITITGASSKV
jgi:mannan endo-1,4-beta-mannosidase